MKSLAPHDRPREKLARVGPAGLGDNELLAVVLGHGSGARNALDLANAILGAVEGVIGLTRLGHADLRRLPGVGAARAGQVVAAIELGRRTLLRPQRARPRFASPREIAAHLLPQFGARPVEQCGVVLLDSRHGLLRTTVLTVGTADASLVHPRDVFRETAVAGAAAFVLFHNHPSGDPEPSVNDVDLTARFEAAAELMGVEFLDHLVLADSRYFSFRERGYLGRGGPGRGRWRR